MEEPIFGNSGMKIILIEKKEYYLVYDHDLIPKLTREKYDSIIARKSPDINLGTIILYDKHCKGAEAYLQLAQEFLQKQNINVEKK